MSRASRCLGEALELYSTAHSSPAVPPEFEEEVEKGTYSSMLSDSDLHIDCGGWFNCSPLELTIAGAAGNATFGFI